MFFIAPDKMRRPVPVWHRSLSVWDLKKSMPSKGVGVNGIRPIIRLSGNRMSHGSCTRAIIEWVFKGTAEKDVDTTFRIVDKRYPHGCRCFDPGASYPLELQGMGGAVRSLLSLWEDGVTPHRQYNRQPQRNIETRALPDVPPRGEGRGPDRLSSTRVATIRI